MSVLEELERLEKAATAGKWHAQGYVSDPGRPKWWAITSTEDPHMVSGDGFLLDGADARLIVAMRNALPALLNVARAAEAAAAMGVPTTDAEVAAWIAARDALRAALAELGEVGE